MAGGEENVVVMFPFMAQGHIRPFLALALQLEQRTNFKIIFVNTPLNIAKIRTSLPANTSVSLVGLPFSSSDHGLPPNSENTDVLPYPLISRLLHASKSLKPSFEQLILDITNQNHGYPPLCIICDMFFGWSIEIANRLNIFHSIFNAGGAYGMAFYFSLWINLPHRQTDSDYFSLSDIPNVSKIHRSQLATQLKIADGSDSWSLFLQKELPLSFKSDGLLINTIEGLDQTGLTYFKEKTGGRPVWTIGPTRFPVTNSKAVTPDRCIAWLNSQSPSSVLFVSFGSQNTISSSQMMELAIGLEASEKKFIWVIRPPLGFDINESFRLEWLPEGFEERMKQNNRGILVHKWGPQLEILANKSTSAFLSHCGWNSILESLGYGVPILGWPLSAEQYYNSKLLEEEVGVCVEIARGSVCEIKHEEIVRAIELVMGETEKGEEMRKKACKVKEIIKDAIREDDDEGYKGSSARSLDEFISTALHMRKKTVEQNKKKSNCLQTANI